MAGQEGEGERAPGAGTAGSPSIHYSSTGISAYYPQLGGASHSQGLARYPAMQSLQNAMQVRCDTVAICPALVRCPGRPFTCRLSVAVAAIGEGGRGDQWMRDGGKVVMVVDAWLMLCCALDDALCQGQTQFWAVREYLAPVLKDSKFKEHGRCVLAGLRRRRQAQSGRLSGIDADPARIFSITPDEYVAAGEFLVYKFPTWQWEGGDKTKARDYLPGDKQYLVQRNGEHSVRIYRVGKPGLMRWPCDHHAPAQFPAFAASRRCRTTQAAAIKKTRGRRS